MTAKRWLALARIRGGGLGWAWPSPNEAPIAGCEYGHGFSIAGRCPDKVVSPLLAAWVGRLDDNSGARGLDVDGGPMHGDPAGARQVPDWVALVAKLKAGAAALAEEGENGDSTRAWSFRAAGL